MRNISFEAINSYATMRNQFKETTVTHGADILDQLILDHNTRWSCTGFDRAAYLVGSNKYEKIRSNFNDETTYETPSDNYAQFDLLHVWTLFLTELLFAHRFQRSGR